MSEENKEIKRSKSYGYLIGFVSLISIFIGGAFWINMILDFPDHQFIFRPYALLSLTALIINLALITLLFRKIQLAEAGFWFLATLGSVATWSFTEFMQRISATPLMTEAWRLPAVFSWSIMPILYLFFVLSYVDKQYLIRRAHFQLALFLIVTSIIYAQLTTDLVLSNDYFLRPWGFDSENHIYLNVYGFWITLIFIIAMAMLIIDYRNSVSIKRRKQIKIFIIGLSVSLAGGFIADILLPVAGYDVLNLSVFFSSIHGLIVGYGIYKHGMFSVSPETLSGEIMETLPQPVIVTDRNLDIQFMNANADEMFSMHGSLVGKNIKDLFGKENYSNIKTAVSNIGKNKIVNLDRLPLSIGQNIIIAQAKIKLIPQSGGYIFGLSNITQQVLSMEVIEKEVKNRTQLYNQEKARLMASIDGLRQGFLIIDDKQRINLMNSKSQKMFTDIQLSNVQPGHVVDGSKVADLNKYFENVELDKLFEEATKTNQYITRKKIEFKSRIIDIDVTPVIVGDNAVGAVILFDDVTDVAMAERSKDEFFSIASHELRTPLTAIRGNTSMLLSYYKEQLTDSDMQNMLSDIHESSRRLIEIVNDFLDTSRLEQGRMQFNMQKVKLSESINFVIKETSMVASEHGNTVEMDPSVSDLPAAYADPDKLKQVLYNLIGNSIKFTKDGLINISASIEKDLIRIKIKDQGRGINEESRKLLFKKFQQANSSIITRDTTKGTGLGLYISKMLIDKMGGSIRLDSTEVDKGSVFSFTLPIAGTYENNSKFNQKIL